MRFRPVLLLAILTAVIAAAVAGLAPAASRSTVPGALRPAAGYNFHAEFRLTYEVKWSATSGDPAHDCSEWSATSGTNEVNVISVAPIAGHIQSIYTGSATQGRRSWATITAVGKAKGTVERTLSVSGGFVWPADGCGYPRPPTWVPPRNDCATRPFTSRSAVFRAALRRFDATLDGSSPGAALGKTPFIDFIVAPDAGVPLYRNCEAGFAEEFPVENVGLVVKRSDRRALSLLKPGHIYKMSGDTNVDCTDELPDGATCKGYIDIEVKFQRDR